MRQGSGKAGIFWDLLWHFIDIPIALEFWYAYHRAFYGQRAAHQLPTAPKSLLPGLAYSKPPVCQGDSLQECGRLLELMCQATIDWACAGSNLQLYMTYGMEGLHMGLFEAGKLR